MLTPYSVPNSALNIATKNIPYSVMRSQIRGNALVIGRMDKPGEDQIHRGYHFNDQHWLAATESKQPFVRLMKTKKVTICIAYGASEESGIMTGAMIDLDQSDAGPPTRATYSQ